MFSTMLAHALLSSPSDPTGNVGTGTTGDAANEAVATAAMMLPLMAMYKGKWSTIGIDMEMGMDKYTYTWIHGRGQAMLGPKWDI